MATPAAGYRNAKGQKIPSVTTILSRFKDSGALIKWAYRQGREHENLLAQGLPAPHDLYDKSATTAQSALAGTIAHDAIEQHVLKGGAAAVFARYAPDTDAAIVTRARNSYAQFLQWFKQTQIEITHTEMPLVSKLHDFGGTPDAMGRINGVPVLLDWKTSNGVYADYLYQLAAYGLLLEENHPEMTPRGYYLLRVAKEYADFSYHFWGELDKQKEAFLLMRALYDVDAETKRRAR